MLRLLSASCLISSATTATPFPASPALAASMEAFSAKRLVWLAMDKISSVSVLMTLTLLLLSTDVLKSFSKEDVLALVKRTLEIIDSRVFFSVTIPGEISISEQIDLARELEAMGIDLIQTEGHFASEQPANGVRGLMERAQLTLSNTIELSRNVEMPVMTATGINPTTAPFAFAAGASAIGCGSCINKMNSEISMIATAKQLVEIAS